MTAVPKKFRDNPEFQIAQQKMRAMTPQQQAIISDQGLEDYFVERQMKKDTQSQQMGMQLKGAEHRQGMGEERLTEQGRQFDLSLKFGREAHAGKMGLAERQLDFAEGEDASANTIAKWGMLTSVAFGIEDFMSKRKRDRYMIENYPGIYGGMENG